MDGKKVGGDKQVSVNTEKEEKEIHESDVGSMDERSVSGSNSNAGHSYDIDSPSEATKGLGKASVVRSPEELLEIAKNKEVSFEARVDALKELSCVDDIMKRSMRQANTLLRELFSSDRDFVIYAYSNFIDDDRIANYETLAYLRALKGIPEFDREQLKEICIKLIDNANFWKASKKDVLNVLLSIPNCKTLTLQKCKDVISSIEPDDFRFGAFCIIDFYHKIPGSDEDFILEECEKFIKSHKYSRYDLKEAFDILQNSSRYDAKTIRDMCVNFVRDAEASCFGRDTALEYLFKIKDVDNSLLLELSSICTKIPDLSAYSRACIVSRMQKIEGRDPQVIFDLYLSLINDKDINDSRVKEILKGLKGLAQELGVSLLDSCSSITKNIEVKSSIRKIILDTLGQLPECTRDKKRDLYLTFVKDKSIPGYRRHDALSHIQRDFEENDIEKKVKLYTDFLEDPSIDSLARIRTIEDLSRIPSVDQKKIKDYYVSLIEDPKEPGDRYKVDALQILFKMPDRDNDLIRKLCMGIISSFKSTGRGSILKILSELPDPDEVFIVKELESLITEGLLDEKGMNSFSMPGYLKILGTLKGNDTDSVINLAIQYIEYSLRDNLKYRDKIERSKTFKLLLRLPKSEHAKEELRNMCTRLMQGKMKGSFLPADAIILLAKLSEGDKEFLMKVTLDYIIETGESWSIFDIIKSFIKNKFNDSDIMSIYSASISSNKISKSGKALLLDSMVSFSISTGADSENVVKVINDVLERQSMSNIEKMRLIDSLKGKNTELHNNFKDLYQKIKSDLLAELNEEPGENLETHRKKISELASSILLYFGEDTPEGNEAIMKLIESDPDGVYSLFSKIGKVSKEKANLSPDFSSLQLDDGDKFKVRFNNESAFDYSKFEWKPSYSIIKFEYFKRTFTDYCKGKEIEDQDRDLYLNAIKKDYILTKINASFEVDETATKVKFITETIIDKMEEGSEDAITILANFTENIRTCTGGDQEAIDVTATGILMQEKSSSPSDEASVGSQDVLKSNIDLHLLNWRKNILLGHEDQISGIKEVKKFRRLVSEKYDTSFNTHVGLAFNAMAGDVIGCRGLGTPKYDRNADMARSLVKNANKQDLVDLFLSVYTYDRGEDAIREVVQGFFPSKSKITDKEGNETTMMSLEVKNKLKSVIGKDFDLDEHPEYFEIVEFEVDMGDDEPDVYEEPHAISRLGVLEIMKRLGYLSYEKAE